MWIKRERDGALRWLDEVCADDLAVDGGVEVAVAPNGYFTRHILWVILAEDIVGDGAG